MNPWLTMWTQPRATMRRIVEANPNRSLWPLAAIYGFSGILNAFQTAELGTTMAAWALVLLAVIFSPLWGYVLFSIWGWLVSLTGKWLKGAANFQEVRAAYAWSCVPLAANVVLWLLLVLTMGGQIFQNFVDSHLMSQSQITLLFVLLIGKMAFVIWAIVLYLNALAEVQKFSILRAIGNVIIAGILAGVILAIIYSLVSGLVHLKGGGVP